uniref:Uncharacterized protein AlNc14C141G7259 n=1 Tax=Albugo laibachii Nc14 TaxID=890382 RepID=F0WL71_9STRA|nr:conserved hypothetical protein [Albugo laibachii Nc14]|eukprot:CCA22032.1 conserved hypothetical protein [Albugo laibachii Nc14]
MNLNATIENAHENNNYCRSSANRNNVSYSHQVSPEMHATLANSPYTDPSYDINDPTGRNRNRGNYRCSKCGEPKKGHVCSVVLSNYKCTRCRLPKKSCTCSAPQTRSIAVQVEMDEDMTTRKLDLSIQGYQDSTGSFSTFNQDIPLSNQVS